MLSVKCFAQGRVFRICEIELDSESTLKSFFQDDLTFEQRKTISAVIQRIADHGPPNNRKRWNTEGDGIYAIKDGQVRIYCFYDEGRLILLTNGAIKKRDKADPEDLKRAKRLRQVYQEERNRQ
jgi:mRNA-degrading endonuclease RelE of RelBE toxin-antitoxin system